ncbi:MAG: SH3 domain-containing protein [Blautia sp.]|nr:SH3 domain-containing protein [Blautia sp.]
MIPVKGMYDMLKMMLNDRWGYIYGTAGVLWTAEKQQSSEDETTRQYGAQWIDHMVSDCSGVMVYIWKKYGLKIPHGSNSMVRQGYVKGIGTTPKPGYAAFVYKPDSDDYSHVGIVGADGVTVYEAKGTRYGFVTSKVTDAKWNRFGYFKDVDYTDKGGEDMDTPYIAEVRLTSGYLNVRSGPAKEYNSVGRLYDGDRVRVNMHGSEWDFIRKDDLYGYVAARYLIPIEEIREDDGDIDDKTDSDWLKDITLLSENGSRIRLDGKWKIA